MTVLLIWQERNQNPKTTGKDKLKRIPIINFEDKISEINKPWSPIEVALVNDQVVRMALPEGSLAQTYK